MLSAGVPMWRLSAGGGSNLGLCCTEDGLCLGRTPLIERSAGGYVVRPRTDLDRLLKCSSAAADLEGLMRGLRAVKSALDENNLPLAQIAAVQLRIPDLPGFHARALLEGEDRLLKAECGNDLLARADWDPGQHPRAGTPPNPGWFAPSGGPNSEGAARVAQGEEDERAPEEMLDPTAQLREMQWMLGSISCGVLSRATPISYIWHRRGRRAPRLWRGSTLTEKRDRPCGGRDRPRTCLEPPRLRISGNLDTTRIRASDPGRCFRSVVDRQTFGQGADGVL